MAAHSDDHLLTVEQAADRSDQAPRRAGICPRRHAAGSVRKTAPVAAEYPGIGRLTLIIETTAEPRALRTLIQAIMGPREQSATTDSSRTNLSRKELTNGIADA